MLDLKTDRVSELFGADASNDFFLFRVVWPGYCLVLPLLMFTSIPVIQFKMWLAGCVGLEISCEKSKVKGSVRCFDNVSLEAASAWVVEVSQNKKSCELHHYIRHCLSSPLKTLWCLVVYRLIGCPGYFWLWIDWLNGWTEGFWFMWTSLPFEPKRE